MEVSKDVIDRIVGLSEPKTVSLTSMSVLAAPAGITVHSVK